MCGVCGKMFQGTNQRFLLRRHLLTHTGERRHACPYCSYQANQAGNLNRHIRNLHPTHAHAHDLQQAPRQIISVMQASPRGAHPPLLGAVAVTSPLSGASRPLLTLPVATRQPGRGAKPRSPSPSLTPSRSSLAAAQHPLHRPALFLQASVTSTAVSSSSAKAAAPSTTATGAPD